MQDPDQPSLTTPLPAPAGRRPHPALFNDQGFRAGWRLLIWLVVCVVMAAVLQFVLRAARGHLSGATLNDVGRILAVVTLLVASAVMARVERRSMWSYGLSDRRAGPHFLFGCVVGWASLTLMLLGIHAAHHFWFGAVAMHGQALWIAAILNALSFLFEVALFEELLFRGYPLYTLADGIGFWPASILLSLLFAAAHLGNPGEAKAGIIAVVVFGLMLCLSVWRTGTLVWAIGFHAMWDYSETFIYGVPDSGFVSPQHLLTARFSGPAWITGGSVGPEGSWFIFLVLALIALAIHLVYPRRQFGRDAIGSTQ